jgi:hypothetical protein
MSSEYARLWQKVATLSRLKSATDSGHYENLSHGFEVYWYQ